MISRNKGLFSIEFLVPILAFLFALISVQIFYVSYVRPNAKDFLVKRQILMSQGAGGDFVRERPAYIIIKDREPQMEIVFCLWGMIVLGYKFIQVTKERALFKQDFVREIGRAS